MLLVFPWVIQSRLKPHSAITSQLRAHCARASVMPFSSIITIHRLTTTPAPEASAEPAKDSHGRVGPADKQITRKPRPHPPNRTQRPNRAGKTYN